VVHLFAPATLPAVGLVGMTASGMALFITAVLDVGGLGTVLACMFVVLTSLGFVMPNASALALNDFPQAAGSASALLGILQFGAGAVVAPLVGLGSKHTVVPMAVVIAACTVVAIVVRQVLLPRGEPGPSAESTAVDAAAIVRPSAS
jgi:MFS transporter, DHA1 family, multidrug resistance protein